MSSGEWIFEFYSNGRFVSMPIVATNLLCAVDKFCAIYGSNVSFSVSFATER